MVISRWIIVFIGILLIVFYSVHGFAAIHYVSTTGEASWANSTDIAQPCSWITAMANAVAGDLVYFRGGTYDLGTFDNHASMAYTKMYPTNSGTGDSDSQRIIFKAYPGETPVITGTVTASSQECWFGCSLSNSYITWDGFKATLKLNQGSYETAVFSAYGNYCTIKNSEFVGIDVGGREYNTSLVRVEHATNAVVENNYFHDLTNGVNNTPAIWVFGAYGPNYIRNNTIVNCMSGINAKTTFTSAKIYKNFIYNNPSGTVGGYAMRLNYEGGSPSGGLTEVYQNVIVWRNVIEQSVIQIQPSYPDADYLFYNNTIYAPTQSGWAGIILTNADITGLQIFNNVMYAPSRYVTYTTGSVSVSDYNIFYASSHAWVLGETTYSSLANWQSTGYDTHSYVEDPTFANAGGTSSVDYKISSAHKNSGRGGSYASVIGAYITGNECIGYGCSTSVSTVSGCTLSGASLY